jgi:hypothetical protein
VRSRLAPVLQLPWGDALTLVAVVFRLGLVFIFLDRQTTSYDINRYFNIVNDGIPYRGQAVEFPPLTVGVLELIHVFGHDRYAFGVGVVVCMAVIEALVCVVMWRSFGRKVGLAFLILDTPLYFLLLTRVDIVSVALAAACVALALRSRQVSGALMWVAAVAAKLWPFPLGVYLLTSTRQGSTRQRAIAAALAGGAILGGAWLAIGGVDGVSQVLTFRGSRGWQVESFGGSLVHLFGGGGVYFEQGSNRIGQVPPGLGLAMQTVGFLAAIAVCAWAGRQGRPGVGWVTMVMCLLASTTLLSPQYLIWAVPGAALAVRESRPWLVAWFTVTIGLTVLESRAYGGVLNGAFLGQALLLLRNLTLLGTLAVGIRSLMEQPLTSPATSR